MLKDFEYIYKISYMIHNLKLLGVYEHKHRDKTACEIIIEDWNFNTNLSIKNAKVKHFNLIRQETKRMINNLGITLTKDIDYSFKDYYKIVVKICELVKFFTDTYEWTLEEFKKTIFIKDFKVRNDSKMNLIESVDYKTLFNCIITKHIHRVKRREKIKISFDVDLRDMDLLNMEDGIINIKM